MPQSESNSIFMSPHTKKTYSRDTCVFDINPFFGRYLNLIDTDFKQLFLQDRKSMNFLHIF